MTEFKVGQRVTHRSGVVTVTSTSGTKTWVRDDFGGVWWDRDESFSPIHGDGEGDIPLQDWEKELLLTPFEQSVHRVTSKIADLLIAKNKAYGDSALNPVRIFSKASRIEQLNVRIDDKISRIQRGTDFGDEDTVRDLIGYLVLRLIAEESE